MSCDYTECVEELLAIEIRTTSQSGTSESLGDEGGLEGTGLYNFEDGNEPGKPGRRMKDGGLVIRKMKTAQENEMKFDNICVKFTRKLISFIRKLTSKTRQISGSFAFDLSTDPYRKGIWLEMTELASANKDFFVDLIKPGNTPNTEHKAQRKVGKFPMSPWNCFCADFTKQFYGPFIVRQMFYLMVELIFGTPIDTAANLCMRVKAKCCKNQEHLQKCDSLWRDYKTFVQVTMLKRLELQPFTPEISGIEDDCLLVRSESELTLSLEADDPETVTGEGSGITDQIGMLGMQESEMQKFDTDQFLA